MTTYNPYLNLVNFAGLNVLKAGDHPPYAYPDLEIHVYIGAAKASFWLVDGKPISRDEAINQLMANYSEVEKPPLPADLAQRLMERGFDWLAQFEIEDNLQIQRQTHLNTEAV